MLLWSLLWKLFEGATYCILLSLYLAVSRNTDVLSWVVPGGANFNGSRRRAMSARIEQCPVTVKRPDQEDAKPTNDIEARELPYVSCFLYASNSRCLSMCGMTGCHIRPALLCSSINHGFLSCCRDNSCNTEASHTILFFQRPSAAKAALITKRTRLFSSLHRVFDI